uniref:SSD domain-containing protein n=1 Tax=Meloidogyne hapla TaxID=6305 RepID=A0A1I8BQY0_MELHA
MSLLTLFRKVGFIVGKRPKTIFLINLFLFLPSLTFYLIYDIKVETDVRRGFSPKNGRATKEMEAFSEFYNVSIDGLDLLLIFLESKTSDKQVDFMDNYIKELSLEINDEGSSDQKISNNKSQVVRLKDFQTSRGDMNYLFHAFKWAYQLQSTSLLFTSKLIKQINLDFPISHIYGFDVLLDSHFYGVKLRESNQSQMFASKIESVETIGIFYLLDGDKNKNQMEILNKLEVKLFNDINTGKLNNLTFKVLIYADQLANHEMMRGSKKITSLLGIGVAAMILFLIVAFWHFNWKSQFILITSSLLSPLLSISVAFSIIGWIGIKFNSIMPIMPFLVFGIGVDNAFLLIHSWRKWALIEQKELNENKENDQKKDSKSKINFISFNKDIFPQRMANVFEEMGSSIAITSLTNGIAFGIGIFSPSSLMSNFCLCTSIAIFLDFLFEFLIFAPCLPLIKWKIEENGEEINEIKNEKKEIIFSIKKENWPLFGKIKSKKESYSSFSSSFLRFYSKFLVSFRAKIFMFVLLFFSYILAFFGINQMETSFVPERTFPGDSPLQNTIKIFNRIMKEHSPISFFVFHPPNISDPVELSDFNRMITILQNLPNTLHVQIWLNGYLEYHKNKINLNNSINYHPSYSLVPQFLNERRMADKRIVQFKDYGLGNISVESFVFGISRGGNLNWLERAFFVDKIRHIVDQFPKFNVTVFDYDSTIYDLILGVKVEL